MEIRIIDGKLFVAAKQGKRETFLRPEQVIENARQEVATARDIVADLRDKEQATQSLLESALLALESTSQHRVDLGAIAEEIKAHEHDAAQARAVIAKVDELVDGHTAAAIRQADADRLAAVLKPFVEFIGAHNVC
ncbi:MAG: hypothetical protein ACOYNZ_07355 [Rhodoferax sp.]